MPNIVIGLLALAFGLWGLSVWWWSVTELLRGLMPILLLGIGFVALAAGVTSVQKKEPEEDDSDDDQLDDDEVEEIKKEKPIEKPENTVKPKAVVKKAVKKPVPKSEKTAEKPVEKVAERPIVAAAKAEANLDQDK